MHVEQHRPHQEVESVLLTAPCHRGGEETGKKTAVKTARVRTQALLKAEAIRRKGGKSKNAEGRDEE